MPSSTTKNQFCPPKVGGAAPQQQTGALKEQRPDEAKAIPAPAQSRTSGSVLTRQQHSPKVTILKNNTPDCMCSRWLFRQPCGCSSPTWVRAAGGCGGVRESRVVINSKRQGAQKLTVVWLPAWGSIHGRGTDLRPVCLPGGVLRGPVGKGAGWLRGDTSRWPGQAASTLSGLTDSSHSVSLTGVPSGVGGHQIR